MVVGQYHVFARPMRATHTHKRARARAHGRVSWCNRVLFINPPPTHPIPSLIDGRTLESTMNRFRDSGCLLSPSPPSDSDGRGENDEPASIGASVRAMTCSSSFLTLGATRVIYLIIYLARDAVENGRARGRVVVGPSDIFFFRTPPTRNPKHEPSCREVADVPKSSMKSRARARVSEEREAVDRSARQRPVFFFPTSRRKQAGQAEKVR